MTEIADQHKHMLKAYFDGQGFERWRAIYGDAQVSRIRRTIRDGHARTVATAQGWLAPLLAGRRAPHVLDAGCGTGLLSVALARAGARVTAVDFAPQMAQATRQAADAAGVGARVRVITGDLEQADGQFDAVVCLDVLIHYAEADFARIAGQLAQRARGPLLLTYAPSSPLLAAMHWLGGRFPIAHRRTTIQMLRQRFVHSTLGECGMRVRRNHRVSQGFYHVALLEAQRHET